MGRTRRKLSSEEKLKMVMTLIQDGKAVSDVAQENNVHPNMILKVSFTQKVILFLKKYRFTVVQQSFCFCFIIHRQVLLFTGQ